MRRVLIFGFVVISLLAVILFSEEPNDTIAPYNDTISLEFIGRIGTCYGVSIECIDVNAANHIFDFYGQDCNQTANVYIKIGNVEKTYTTEEFFTLLGFDMENGGSIRDFNVILCGD